MSYKALIRLKGSDGNIKEELKPLPAQSERDAKSMIQNVREATERIYGKTNVISVTLVEE